MYVTVLFTLGVADDQDDEDGDGDGTCVCVCVHAL